MPLSGLSPSNTISTQVIGFHDEKFADKRKAENRKINEIVTLEAQRPSRAGVERKDTQDECGTTKNV